LGVARGMVRSAWHMASESCLEFVLGCSSKCKKLPGQRVSTDQTWGGEEAISICLSISTHGGARRSVMVELSPSRTVFKGGTDPGIPGQAPRTPEGLALRCLDCKCAQYRVRNTTQVRKPSPHMQGGATTGSCSFCCIQPGSFT
jgi:hypothetical protein